MTRPRRWVAGAMIAALVAAWLAWWTTRGDASGRDGEPREPTVGSAARTSTPASLGRDRIDAPAGGGDAVPSPAPDGERTAVCRGVVQVRVTGPRAGAAAGLLLGRPDEGAQTFATAPVSAPFRGMLIGGKGHIEVDNTVPTRLLVHDQEAGVRRHVRIEPFQASTQVDVALASEQVVVHVLVLDERLDDPVPGCRVLVERVGALPGEIVAQAMTDAHGEATLDVVAGEISLRTERASPVDATPWRRSLTVGPRCEAAESFVILSTPPPRFSIQLEVHVAGLGQGGLPGPRLFLRSVDGGDVVPLRHHLRLGQQMLDADVFEGSYEVDALPFGQVDVSSPSGLVVVGGSDLTNGSPRRKQVIVSSRPERTLVTLLGVAHDEFPLRVTLRQPEACPSVGQDLFILGPTAWHLPALNLPRWQGRRQLVVFTRRRTLLSPDPIECIGSSVEVRLVPATLVRVCTPTTGAGRRTTLTVSHAAGSLVVPLRLDIVRDNRVDRPALVGEVVVPQGSATLDCGEEDRLLWRRTVRLTSAVTTLP